MNNTQRVSDLLKNLPPEEQAQAIYKLLASAGYSRELAITEGGL